MKIIDFSDNPVLRDAVSWIAPINQQYHPSGEILVDSQDIVYSYNNLNRTKFTSILLKEWFSLVSPEGYLVVDYEPNDLINYQSLESGMWRLWKTKYEIISHGKLNLNEHASNTLSQITYTVAGLVNIQQNDLFRFVCKKKVQTKIKDDSIDKWTFGIVTSGKRTDWIEKLIISIRNQKIPNYEIIICGSYFDRGEEDCKYIEFKERDEKGWITKKKNLIVEAAQYENMCIMHDRVVLDNCWYIGMKKWGNNFEHLSCHTQYNDKNTGDWPFMDVELMCGVNHFLLVSSLEYTDWHTKSFVGGTIHIGKKSIFSKIPWREDLYWGDGEDYYISLDLSKAGHIPRFNIDAKIHALAARFTEFPKITYDEKSFRARPEKLSIKRGLIKLLVNLKLKSIVCLIDKVIRIYGVSKVQKQQK